MTLRRAAALILFGVGCRGNALTALTGALVFSSPDQPAELTQPDAGIVQIAFGQVLTGETKTLTLDFASAGTPVTLGALAALQPDSELSLPFVAGTVAQSTPSQITVSFTPTSAGTKSATFQLTDYAPGPGTILFELSGQGVASQFTVAPNPVDFGQVEIHQSQSIPLTITNNGTLAESFTLSALQGSDAAHFTRGAPSTTALAPGASATLTVGFAPLTEGAAGAAFTVSGLGPEQPLSVSLIGQGIARWLQVTSPLDFGFVQLGDTIVKSALVTNLSAFTTLHLVVPAPMLIEPAAPFSLIPSAASLPIAIPPGHSAQIPVMFSPLSLQMFTGTLDLTTDDPLGKVAVVELQGYGGGPHISCLPILGFGPVPLGATVSDDSYCLNSGAAIPSMPKIGLTIAQDDLSTDDPAFVPALVLPDGGLAGPGYSVSLRSGQQAKIRVAFHAEDAGAFASRLTVPSNDIDDLDAGTILLAQGGLNGPCNLQVTPMELAFGEVAAGSSGILEFELLNTSQELCHISQVAIDPASDPAFSVADGGIDNLVLSYAGSTDTPGMSSFAILQAEYAPATYEQAAVGKINVRTVNGAPLDQSIALSGSSWPTCLSIAPPNLDFGLVGFSPSMQQICLPDSASFVAVNACTRPVTVNQIGINSGLDGVPQFSLQDALTLPLTIAPGGQATFQASFVPTSLGPKIGAISVSCSEPPEPFLVTLQGNAALTGTRTDTFTIPPLPKKVDLLWVLDNDDDIDQMKAMANEAPQLIAAMDQAQIDYQIAFTTTDTCAGDNSDRGAFEPCDHCLNKYPTSAYYFTPASPDPGDGVARMFNGVGVGVCNPINGDEHFFDSIADAFSPTLLSGHNSGFIRDGAYLAIVIVNDDTEDDANGGGFGEGVNGPYLTSLAQVTSLVESLKADPAMLSVSFVDANSLAPPLVHQLVQATGGTEMRAADTLLDLFFFLHGFHPLQLSSPAVSPIQVDVNGVPTTDFYYDPYVNELWFGANVLPAQGATVTATYMVGCP